MRFLILVIVLALLALPSQAGLADPEHLTIENEGWILHGDRYNASGGVPVAMALLFHNAGANRSDYRRFAKKLAANGITSIAVDLRGHGESTNLDTFDWKIRKNFEINKNTWKDVVATMKLVEADGDLKGLPLIFIGASYSGEKMAEAARNTTLPDLMIEFSPGSFSDASIAMFDPSDIPWLFIRAEKELPFFDPLFNAIRAGSKNAEIWRIAGEGHGTHILNTRPELEDRVISWINNKLISVKN